LDFTFFIFSSTSFLLFFSSSLITQQDYTCAPYSSTSSSRLKSRIRIRVTLRDEERIHALNAR
jgi:hypothetical protein